MDIQMLERYTEGKTGDGQMERTGRSSQPGWGKGETDMGQTATDIVSLPKMRGKPQYGRPTLGGPPIGRAYTDVESDRRRCWEDV